MGGGVAELDEALSGGVQYENGMIMVDLSVKHCNIWGINMILQGKIGI